jgi:HEAT repeat protein
MQTAPNLVETERDPSPRAPVDEWQECVGIVEALPRQESSQRAAAIEQLLRNASATIRKQALHLGSVLLSEAQLVDYLRNGSDDVLRNAGLEILKLRGNASIPLALRLLGDSDADVVLQAVLLLDHFRDGQAIEPLLALLSSPDANLVQAAITALGHIGNVRVAPELMPFLHGDPWLQFAAVRAVGDVRATATLPTLAKLIHDSFVGPVAIEAIGRIGGSTALQILSRHWNESAEHLGLDALLALTAEVAESLPRVDRRSTEIRDLLRPFLQDELQHRSYCSARALLALGPGEDDTIALSVLIASTDAPALPRCLRMRKDLLNVCLTDVRMPRSWSFEMLSLWPMAAHSVAVGSLLRRMDEQDLDAGLANTLANLRSQDIGRSLLALFIRVSPEKRRLLLPVLQQQKRSLNPFIGSEPLDAATRLVLVAALGQKFQSFVDDLCQLELHERLQVLSDLADQRKLMWLVPWKRIVAEAPEAYAPVVARVASETGLRSLRPILRMLLGKAVFLPVIRAVGLLRDELSVPLLLERLKEADALVEAYVVEALGRIGGDASRAALHALLASVTGDRRRNAMKALAECATAEDMDDFRRAAMDPDWVVRMACVDALSRFRSPENSVVMATLVADPLVLVAQRARAQWRE